MHLKGRIESGQAIRRADEALRDYLRQLRDGPVQEVWNPELDTEGFIRSALSSPDWQFIAGRLRYKGSVCNECIRNDRSKVGTVECPKRRWTLNAQASAEAGHLVMAANDCPFLSRGGTYAAEETLGRFLRELNIASEQAASWAFETLARPKRGDRREEHDRAVALCLDYTRNHGDHWLYIYSRAHGTGKTRLAVATAIRMAEGGIPARYVNFPTLYAAYKGKLGARDEEDSHIDMVAHTLLPEVAEFDGVLVLDDIGKEIPSPRTLEWLYIITDRRGVLGYPTILTSNYDVGTLEAAYAGTSPFYAEAILSRIIGMVGEVGADMGNGEKAELIDTYQICLDHQKDYRRALSVYRARGITMGEDA